MSFSASPHLRGILIAGALAAVAMALGFVTLSMNQSSSNAAVHTVLPLKDRVKHAAPVTTAAKPKAVAKAGVKAVAKPTVKAKAKPVHHEVSRFLTAAIAAGLPSSIARGLAQKPVVVVALTSKDDSVAQMTAAESRAGAALAGAAFTTVSVDVNSVAMSQLTRMLGQVPTAPATLFFRRPGTLFVSLSGFNDRTTVQQAAVSAVSSPAAARPAPAPAVTTTATTPAATPPVTSS